MCPISNVPETNTITGHLTEKPCDLKKCNKNPNNSVFIIDKQIGNGNDSFAAVGRTKGKGKLNDEEMVSNYRDRYCRSGSRDSVCGTAVFTFHQ